MSRVSVVWIGLLLIAGSAAAMDMFLMPEGSHTRWFSFENPTGAAGSAAQENQGAKGHAFDALGAGETRVLMEQAGAGTIRRMWFTVDNRSPEMLRSLRLRMYWDSAATPAVDVPFGDFFCAILGHTTAFENELFSNPEGRSFNCCIPMPFRDHAKVTLTNESGKDLEKLFYDIDITTEAAQPEAALYFHATWHRERWTELGKDFELLPKVSGRGRFLGANIGVITHPDNVGWWGEGEVKMYADGDAAWPTIAGTGSEDYIGTGWGQGEYAHRYQGCLLADNKKGHFGMYRFHVPDPVYFQSDIRVTLQQIGGASKKEVLQLLEKGVAITPVSINPDNAFIKLIDPPRDLRDPSLPDGWANFYRRDDVCAVAYYFLDRVENGLPSLAPAAERVEGL